MFFNQLIVDYHILIQIKKLTFSSVNYPNSHLNEFNHPKISMNKRHSTILIWEYNKYKQHKWTWMTLQIFSCKHLRTSQKLFRDWKKSSFKQCQTIFKHHFFKQRKKDEFQNNQCYYKLIKLSKTKLKKIRIIKVVRI